MIDKRNIYNDYIKSVQYRISKATDKLSKYENSKKYITSMLIENKGVFESMGINFDALLSNPLTAYTKVVEYIKFGQLTKVGHYIKGYSRVHGYINFYKLTIERLNACIMPYEAYIRILNIANDTIASNILQGEIYTFNGSVGKLCIKEVPRTFSFKGVPTKQPVDWGKSNAYKKELLEQGVTLYNSKNSPDGIKWLVKHTNELNYWFWWEGGPMANRKYFRFYPTKFCNFSHKYKVKFLKACKNIDDILTCSRLGNLDKMHELLRFDSTYYINYKN